MATIIVSKNTTGTYANTGYTGFVDTKLRGLNPTTNYSTDTTFATTSWDKSGGDVETTVLKADISSVGAGTVSSAEIGFYLDNGNNVDSSGVSLFALLVDFVETQATFNIRKTSNNWNTGGARGSGTDRQSTAFITVSRPATSGAWIQFSGTAVDDMVQDWLDGTLTNNGFVAELQNHDIDPFFTYQSYISSEGTDGNRPYLKFDHTSSGVTAALTGQSISSAQGSLTESISYALTSQVIASSQGSFTDVVSKALNGQVITSQQGTLSGAVNKALTGQEVTVSQGTISADNAITRALTGQSITASQGDVSETVANALTGHSASVNQGNLTNAVTYGITGQSATSSQGTIADSVLVGLTGQQITSAQGDVLSNGDVTRALSGQSITAQQGVLTAPQENLFGGVAHFKILSERSRKLRELEAQERTAALTSEDIAEVIQIPQEVKEIISNVAKIDNEKKQRAQLKAQLKALEIQFRQEYSDALKTEMIRQYLIIEQERQEEEETIAMMMMALV